jgi:hypothetical protein
LKGIAAHIRPERAAQRDYQQSVAEYRNCLAANPTNVSACEGLRHVMDVKALLSGNVNSNALLSRQLNSSK